MPKTRNLTALAAACVATFLVGCTIAAGVVLLDVALVLLDRAVTR